MEIQGRLFPSGKNGWENGMALLKRAPFMNSSIGARARISEMLEFAARHKLTPQVECYPLNQVNEAIIRVRENRGRYLAVVTKGYDSLVTRR